STRGHGDEGQDDCRPLHVDTSSTRLKYWPEDPPQLQASGFPVPDGGPDGCQRQNDAAVDDERVRDVRRRTRQMEGRIRYQADTKSSADRDEDRVQGVGARQQPREHEAGWDRNGQFPAVTNKSALNDGRCMTRSRKEFAETEKERGRAGKRNPSSQPRRSHS